MDDLVDLLSPLFDVFTGINHQFDYEVVLFLDIRRKAKYRYVYFFQKSYDILSVVREPVYHINLGKSLLVSRIIILFVHPLLRLSCSLISLHTVCKVTQRISPVARSLCTAKKI